MKRVIISVIFGVAFGVQALAAPPLYNERGQRMPTMPTAASAPAPAPAPQPDFQALQLQDQLSDAASQLRLTQQAQANASAEFIAERVMTLKLQNQLGQISQASNDKDKQLADKDKEIADLKGQIASAEKSEKAAVGEPPAPVPAPAPDGVMKGTIVPPPPK